jgi:hypothetical protein
MGFALLNDADASSDAGESVAFGHRPVDLAHLSRHTKGDTVAERELLAIFQRQMLVNFDRLRFAQDINAWSAAAKQLLTSARSVGAWRIVNAAEGAERIANAPVAAREELMVTMKLQIEEANSFIAKVLEHT